MRTKRSRVSAAILCAVVVVSVAMTPAIAGSKRVGDFRFNGNLKNKIDNRVRASNLTGINAPNFFAMDVVNGNPKKALFIPADSGLAISRIPAGARKSFTIDLFFRSNQAWPGSDYCRLVAFGPNVTDEGLYVYGGHLYLYDYVEAANPLPENTYMHITITRSASDQLQVFLNGSLEIAYADLADGFWLRKGKFELFQDDSDPTESCAMVLSRLKISKGVVA